MLTGGQVHDFKATVDVLSGIDISGSNILGDKAYGTEKIRTYITEQNAKYTITSRENDPDPWYCGLCEKISVNSKTVIKVIYWSD